MGFRLWALGFRVQGFGLRVWRLAWCAAGRVTLPGFRDLYLVWCVEFSLVVGFGVLGSWCRVEG